VITKKSVPGNSPLRRVRWSSRQLEIFLAVVEEKGFSAAGERLHMVQPAVSSAIRKIEEAAGVRLLDRSSGMGVTPTGEGLLFLSYARAICRQMDELAVQLNDLRSLNAGHIVLGAPPATMEFILSALASDFLAQHPGLTFGATTGSDETTMARVRTREIDIGFVPGPVIADDLELQLILRQPLACCVPEGSPLAEQPEITWREIMRFPLALFPRGYNQRSQIDETANQMGLRPNVIVESESSGFLLEMVRAGHALSITFAGVGRAIKGIRVVPIETRPSVPISICRRTDGYISTAANSFYDYVIQHTSDSATRQTLLPSALKPVRDSTSNLAAGAHRGSG
jgi:DNA-binding transcriptional LysR family regulator